MIKSTVSTKMQKLIIVVFLFLSLNTWSQINSPILPGTFNIGGGTTKVASSFFLDWSIGESTIIDTWYGENAEATTRVGKKWNITGGVLQPFDKNQKLFDANIKFWTQNEIHLFPVPTFDVITIDFRSLTTGKITIQLLGADGREISIKQVIHQNERSAHSFSLRNRPSGLYYFNIILTSASGQQLKQGVFKFEKLH
jgi:hypothetical protein